MLRFILYRQKGNFYQFNVTSNSNLKAKCFPKTHQKIT